MKARYAEKKKFKYEIIVSKDKTFKEKYENQWMHDEVSGEDISFYPKWDVPAREACGVLPKILGL